MTDPRITRFLDRVETYLAPLPKTEREDILAEVKSHLIDSEAAGAGKLEAALEGLGSPEAFARQYLDDEALRKALAGGGPADLFLSVLRRAPRSVGALIGFAGVAGLYLFALSFYGIVILDLTHPEQTGLWVGDGMEPFFLGMISGSGPGPGVRDVAGPWIIPLALGLAVGCTIGGLAFSRLIARLLLRK